MSLTRTTLRRPRRAWFVTSCLTGLVILTLVGHSLIGDSGSRGRVEPSSPARTPVEEDQRPDHVRRDEVQVEAPPPTTVGGSSTSTTAPPRRPVAPVLDGPLDPPSPSGPSADLEVASGGASEPPSSLPPVSPIMDDGIHRGRFAIECVNCQGNDDGFEVMNGRLTAEFRLANIGEYPLHIWFDDHTGLDFPGVTWTLHGGTTITIEMRACQPIYLEGPGVMHRTLTVNHDGVFGDQTYDLWFFPVAGQPIYPC